MLGSFCREKGAAGCGSSYPKRKERKNDDEEFLCLLLLYSLYSTKEISLFFSQFKYKL